VGRTLGIFTAIEMKSETGRVRYEQTRFLAAVTKHGGRAGAALSVADARRIRDGG
jgi:hypothetical protein